MYSKHPNTSLIKSLQIRYQQTVSAPVWQNKYTVGRHGVQKLLFYLKIYINCSVTVAKYLWAQVIIIHFIREYQVFSINVMILINNLRCGILYIITIKLIFI